jgi:hypothetical protein
MGMERVGRVDLASAVFGGGGARTIALLKAAWPHAVGPALAGRTEPIALEGTTLRVRVPDQGWMRVLHRMQPQILARLAAIAGGLAPRRLGFVEGPVDRPSPPAAPAPAATTHEAELPASVTAQAAAIDDPEIRDGFLRSAALYLSRPSSGRKSHA